MDWDKQTVKVYDDSAKALAQYYKDIGPRVKDIERGLSLAGANKNARVIEIGCAYGREADEIIKRVGSFIGIDPYL